MGTSAVERYLEARNRSTCSLSATRGTIDISPWRCGSGACSGGPNCLAVLTNEAAAEIWAARETRPGKDWEDVWARAYGVLVASFTLQDAYYVLDGLGRRRR